MERAIAIIGVSFELPGIRNWNELIVSINESKCHIGDLSEKRKDDVFSRFGEFELAPRGYLERIDLFDKDYFNITKIDALRMSPEQRLMLTHSMRAFYDGGYTQKQLKGSNTGVFYVANKSMYEHFSDSTKTNLVQLQGMEGTRIANFLDLRGPVIALNTTCSSSLVAMHYAGLSLKNNECDIALVGGVKLGISNNISNTEVTIRSKQGACKPFDEEADGTVGGEGVICMVLKRLEDAKRDMNPIYGVIEGSALNHGGNRISSLTAPSSEAQKEVILKAWDNSGVSPEKIRYIEAHGTGTILGDPIEFKGLKDAFKEKAIEGKMCSISSFKAQIGHLDIMSGIAGTLRLLAALNYKTLPPQVGFNKLNKHINEEGSSVHIQQNYESWESEGEKRIGGVSSFGLTGTNAHMVISAEDKDEHSLTDKEFYFIQISEKSEQRLKGLKSYLADYLIQRDWINLNIFTNKINRIYTGNNFKEGIVYSSKKELIDKLNILIPKNKKQVRFYLLILNHLQYNSNQINDIFNDNILIQKQWNIISNGEIDIFSISNTELQSILFQYTLCKYFLAVGGASVTIIYKKEESTIRKLLARDLTINELIANPKLIKESTSSFNIDGFVNHLAQFTDKKEQTVVFSFCHNNEINDALDTINTLRIDGHFNEKDRYTLYMQLLDSDKEPLEVPNNSSLLRDLELPYYELKRYWPENESLLVSNEAINKVKKDNTDLKKWTINEIEDQLKIFWKTYLEIEEFIEIDDDFFELGGSSLTGLDILNEIEKKFAVILRYQDIFDYSKLKEMVSLINNRLNESELETVKENVEVEKLVDTNTRKKAYSSLIDSITDIKIPSRISPNKILVTGATGFLGAFLIKILLENTNVPIVCIVRGKNDQEATVRFWDRFSAYFNILKDNRIHILAGDITKNDLGLKNQKTDILKGIDIVYHSAGLVSHFGKYESSYKANVEGTRNVFNWANNNGVKYFNHTSTGAVRGVFIPGSDNDNFYETDLNIGQDFLNHIYGKTKLEAEEYIRSSDSKMSINVYRLGNLGGRYDDGLFQYNIDKNSIYLRLATLAKIGRYSDSINALRFEITPIDIIAKTIYELSLTHNEALSTFHLYDSQRYTLLDVIESFHNNGIDIAKVSDIDLITYINELDSKEAYSKDLLSLGVQRYRNNSRPENGILENTDQCTLKYIEKLGINLKYDRKKYLDTIINYCIKEKFFDIK